MSTVDVNLSVSLPIEVVTVADAATPITISEVASVISVVDTGLRGPAGQDGQGAATAVFTAVGTTGAGRIVTGALTYADKDTSSHAGKVIGVTANSALIGDPLTVQSSGKMMGFAGLTPNEPVYVGTNGVPTQTYPLTGFVQQIGTAITADTVIIEIGTPIGR